MKDEIIIHPDNGRYWLYRKYKKVGNVKYGYKTYESAAAAKWFLTNAKGAMQAQYKMKQSMSGELSHFKNI